LAQAEVFAITEGQEKLIALVTATLMSVKGRDGISDWLANRAWCPLFR